MKSFLLAFALAVSLLFATNSLAQTKGGSFVITNELSAPLGEITVNAPGGSYYAVVPGSISDTIDISPDTTVNSIAINGQTVPEGVKAIVTLPGGTQAGVLWVSPTNVIVVNTEELD